MDNSPFARLPQELRDMVYEYSLPDGLAISEGQHREKHAVFQLCSEMRQEAQLRLFKTIQKSIAAPPNEMQNFHVFYPGLFIPLLKKGITTIRTLPPTFGSQPARPTVIRLHATIQTTTGFAYMLPSVYEQSENQWRRVRKALKALASAARPHKIALTFSCKYYTVPYAQWTLWNPCCLKCKTCPDARDVGSFHVKIPDTNYQAARKALTQAIDETKADIETHRGHRVCSVWSQRDFIMRALANPEKMMEIFLANLFK